MFQAVLHETVLSRLDKDVYNKYAVEEQAASLGVTVIRQPPYHCHFNAIEMTWSHVKRVRFHHALNRKQTCTFRR